MRSRTYLGSQVGDDQQRADDEQGGSSADSGGGGGALKREAVHLGIGHGTGEVRHVRDARGKEDGGEKETGQELEHGGKTAVARAGGRVRSGDGVSRGKR